ncbi:tol-pal system YbgF family protein [Pseudomonas sp. CR3202]|uniref:tetratricopeptide repeat protein n=1 Tax=Pseudomonas sp. CR3202 TaxID=3351532 RepID=UPI003BF1F388
MRTLIIFTLLAATTGCTRWSLDHHLNSAYRSFENGDCEDVLLELSKAERKSRSRPYLQPEISLLRGQCLERQHLFVDAAQTYQFIIARYPTSEYAYRARARLETLQQLGRLGESGARSSGAPL